MSLPGMCVCQFLSITAATTGSMCLKLFAFLYGLTFLLSQAPEHFISNEVSWSRMLKSDCDCRNFMQRLKANFK